MISSIYYLDGEDRERGGEVLEEYYIKRSLLQLGYEYARKYAVETTFFEYTHRGELHSYSVEDDALESFEALGIRPKPLSKRVTLTLKEKGEF